MHKDAIFEYSIDGSKDNNNITSVTESGTIIPYDESSNSEFNPKTMYDDFTVSSDVISRLSPLFDSLILFFYEMTFYMYHIEMVYLHAH